MRTPVILLASALVLAVGCSSTKMVSLDQKEDWIESAHNDLEKKSATVYSTEGHMYEGTVLQLTEDSLYLQDDLARQDQAVPLDHVTLIKRPRNVVAPLGGVLGGALVGGLIGSLVGASETTESPYIFPAMFEATSHAMSGAFIGGAIGAVALGGILGLATSVTDYQIISSRSQSDSVEKQKPSPYNKGWGR